MTTTDHAMPELPEPDGYAAISGAGTIIVPPRDFAKHNGYAIFTANQMREYARAAIQQAAGAVPDLLQSCRGSVKADLMRYEQMILSRPSPEYVAAYEQECDRLQALLDSIDALAASPSPLGREAACVSQNAESEPQTILTSITDTQTLAAPATEQAAPVSVVGDSSILRALLVEWLDGMYDGPDFLRRVKLAVGDGLKLATKNGEPS